jgi:DNA modification methylase
VLNKFIPYHMDIADIMKEIGFVLEDIIIWDRRREYNKLRPLGYPYVFVVNKVHEYIMIFRKGEKVQVDTSR